MKKINRRCIGTLYSVNIYSFIIIYLNFHYIFWSFLSILSSLNILRKNILTIIDYVFNEQSEKLIIYEC